MFNRAVSRLSRKRPPSGKRFPGLRGLGIGEPPGARMRRPGRCCLPHPPGHPSLLPEVGRGSAMPRAGRATSPCSVQRPRGPSRGGSAESRDARWGGSLSERRNNSRFLFSDGLGEKGDPKHLQTLEVVWALDSESRTEFWRSPPPLRALVRSAEPAEGTPGPGGSDWAAWPGLLGVFGSAPRSRNVGRRRTVNTR